MTKQVTVYSKTDCMQCNFTKKWLKERNIPYTELNIKEDEEALLKVKEMGFQSVPVIVTEDDSWYGFQPDKLAELVE